MGRNGIGLWWCWEWTLPSVVLLVSCDALREYAYWAEEAVMDVAGGTGGSDDDDEVVCCCAE